MRAGAVLVAVVLAACSRSSMQPVVRPEPLAVRRAVVAPRAAEHTAPRFGTEFVPDRIVADRAGRAPTDPDFDPSRSVTVTLRYVVTVPAGGTGVLQVQGCPMVRDSVRGTWRLHHLGAVPRALAVYAVSDQPDSTGRRVRGSISPIAMPELDDWLPNPWADSAAAAPRASDLLVFDARQPGAYVLDRYFPRISATSVRGTAQCTVALRLLGGQYAGRLASMAAGGARETGRLWDLTPALRSDADTPRDVARDDAAVGADSVVVPSVPAAMPSRATPASTTPRIIGVDVLGSLPVPRMTKP
ncbi:MAG: hypothetical protein ACYC5V_04610 [Gemmatimonadaceae bacterium]